MATAACIASKSAARPSGSGPALAPKRLASLLALAFPLSAGTSTPERRGSRADRHHGAEEPALGHRADPWRAAQARHRRQRTLHLPLPPPRTCPTAQPELAHLPRQPRSGHLGSRSLRGPDPDLPDPLRLLPDQPRPPSPAPLRHDHPPDRRLGLAPDDRGHALGPAPQVPDPRPRSRLRRRLRHPHRRAGHRERPHTGAGAPSERRRRAGRAEPAPGVPGSHPAAERAACPISADRVRSLPQPGSTSPITGPGDSGARPSPSPRRGGFSGHPRRSPPRLRASRLTPTRLLPPYTTSGASRPMGLANRALEDAEHSRQPPASRRDGLGSEWLLR